MLSSVLSVGNSAQDQVVCSVAFLKIFKTTAYCSSLVLYGALWHGAFDSCSAVCCRIGLLLFWCCSAIFRSCSSEMFFVVVLSVLSPS